jgi:hypothetical protein
MRGWAPTVPTPGTDTAGRIHLATRPTAAPPPRGPPATPQRACRHGAVGAAPAGGRPRRRGKGDGPRAQDRQAGGGVGGAGFWGGGVTATQMTCCGGDSGRRPGRVVPASRGRETLRIQTPARVPPWRSQLAKEARAHRNRSAPPAPKLRCPAPAPPPGRPPQVQRPRTRQPGGAADGGRPPRGGAPGVCKRRRHRAAAAGGQCAMRARVCRGGRAPR